MMRKARLAIRKVNVALDSQGYCFGTGRSLIPSSRLFVISEKNLIRNAGTQEGATVKSCHITVTAAQETAVDLMHHKRLMMD